MTSNEIQEKLEAMYSGTGSRNFINHMIRAYFPVNKVEKVWETPKGKFRCAITNEPLFSTVDILSILNSEETKNAFMENMKTLFSDPSTEVLTEPSKPIETMTVTIKDVIKNKKLGITGKETDTYLSYPAYQEFGIWLTNKLLTGDKNINSIVSQMQNIKKVETQEINLNPQPKVVTFGDLDVLQQLKAKLEAQENK